MHTSHLVLARHWIETLRDLLQFHSMAVSVSHDDRFNQTVCVGTLGRKGFDGTFGRA